MTGLAFDVPRYSRKRLKSGLYARSKALTRKIDVQIKRPADGVALTGGRRCKGLKVGRLPSPLRLATGQIHPHQTSHINGF